MMNADIINSVFPIASVDLYKRGVIVKRNCKLQEIPNKDITRKSIEKLSKRSLDRLAFVALNTDVKFLSMLTLTYGDSVPKTGKEAKAQLNAFLTWLRREYYYLEYLWFMEFQPKRKAVHFHLLLNILTPNHWMRHDAAIQWSKIVSRETIDRRKVYLVHRHPRAWEGIRKPDGAMRYVVKYATKVEQKEVPANFRDVGRFWGHSRNVKPQPLILNINMTEAELRQWLKDRGHKTSDFPFIPRYLWMPKRGQKPDKKLDNT